MLIIICCISSCNHSISKKEVENEEVGAQDSINFENIQPIEVEKDTIPVDPIDVINISSNVPAEIISAMKESGHWKEYSEGMLPQIAEKSAQYAKKLLANTHPRFIVVDKSRMKLVLFDRYGRTEKTYGIACAKNYGTKHKKADSRTPEGFFSVEGIYDSTDWLFTDDNGVTSKKKGQFGPRFIRLSIPVTSQIGIHGTCAPWSIGGRSSHGCIRLTNENILELVELVEPGMPVIIVPGSKDMAVNKMEGYDIPWIPTMAGTKEPKFKELKKEETADTIIESKQTDIDSIDKKEPNAPVNDTIAIPVIKSEDKISIDN